MIKFSFISPINYLDLIPTTCDIHMVLAHLLDQDAYRNFYVQRQARGDLIILDNSAFELGAPIETPELLRLVETYKFYPDVIIAPDYPAQSTTVNHRATKEFIKSLRYHSGSTEMEQWASKVNIMAIPQTALGDSDGWFMLHDHYAMNADISYIGISFLAARTAFCEITGSNDATLNRLYCTSKLAISNRHKPVSTARYHLLGLVQPNELLIQTQLKVAYSCDSSSPIWHGLHSIAYDGSFGGLLGGKIQKPVDFALPDDAALRQSNGLILTHNIETIKRLCGHRRHV